MPVILSVTITVPLRKKLCTGVCCRWTDRQVKQMCSFFHCYFFFKVQNVEAMILENHTISAKDSTERRNPLLSLVCV